MKKVKDILILNNNYSCIDFVELDNNGTISFPYAFKIDMGEFNYQLKVVIASYKNLINQNPSNMLQNQQNSH